MRNRYLAPVLLLMMLPLSARAQVAPPDLSRQQPAVLEAFRLADQGKLSVQDTARIADHPLRGWVEATALRRTLGAASAADVRSALRRFDGQPAADWLREAWLLHLAKRGDWRGFRADYRPSTSLELRCAELSARVALGETDAAWVSDAQALWLTGTTLPASCDLPFKSLAAQGKLDAALRWQRIELAATEGQTGLIRFLAPGLPAAEAARARDYADFIDAPHARAVNWPRDNRSRNVAAEGLARLARRSPDAAQAQLDTLSKALGMDEAQRGKVLYQIALWTVASYLPGSSTRLEAVPAASYDERLHEWRVREAMNRRDDASAVRALEAMPSAQRNDPRWQYYEARLRERLGQADQARALYRQSAGTATFHGFLAADRLGQPYTLCPLEPSQDAALRRRVASNPGLSRALELYAIDRPSQAIREWAALLKSLDAAERYVAIEFAQASGWHDRAVFTIGTAPDDLRHYSLRFPLHHETTLRRESRKNAIDPAWVAAQTRAESAFMPRARSPANALGLMQLLPSTAAMTAKRLGIPYGGASSLYDPDTNLVLGIAHLRHELDQHGGIAYQAIAAYNAGPAPVMRWNRDRPGFDPDFWIETVTYKETRDYVARVLAFSVIYDWRLDGDAVPVSERLLGRTVAKAARRPFACPLPSQGTNPP
ncbi:transglycosylase SLT domain-containing protein [Arenimonas sp. MALMAid1274]|uniref:transglycosylase SLT domain-containing protein n=1 Tax=Arenimonas sp. MALMAid1274 TaxID=3411630 RepID=UPI003B9FA548